MEKKVTVVGAGNVGATVAQRLVERELCDVVLIDVVEGLSEGKALDLLEAAPIERHDAKLFGGTNYELSRNSDLVVITAGLTRKPGMSRSDLLHANKKIIEEVTKKVCFYSPQAIIIVVSNPLDAMCQVALSVSGFPRQKIIGMAGVLDAARFATFISLELDVSVEDIQACVLGSHGDLMVPLPRFTTVAGIPVTEFIPPARLEKIIERTRQGGAEIVGLLKTGSAYYAPASAVAVMVEAILKDKKRILPCAAYLEGEYGISGLFVGVPVKLGKSGIEEIITLKLTASELEALKKSADAVRELIEAMNSP